MINILFLIIALLFFLKLLWNMLTPYVANRALRKFQQQGGAKPGGISMALIVEIVLLFLLVVISLFAGDGWWWPHTMMILLYGGCAIVGSYVLAVIISKIT